LSPPRLPEAPPRATRRPRSLPAALLLAVDLLLLAGCAGLKPLPTGPRAPAPGEIPPTLSPEELWQRVEMDAPVPTRAESAWRSTTRMVGGDLSNKRRAQRQATACWEDPPAGFEVLDGVKAPGAAPLFAYLHRGRPDRPLVFVLHGLYDSRNSLYVRRTAEALAARGFGVLVPDLRWHGCLLSEDWLPGLGVFEAQDLVAWSAHLRRELGTERPVGLLGFSLGGLAVIHALAREEAPEAFRAGGVTLSPPAALGRLLPRLEGPSWFADRGLLTLIDRGFRRYLEKRVKDQNIPVPPELAGRPFQAVLRHVGEKLFPAPVGSDAILRFTDPVPALRAARRPLLVLTAADDPLFGSTVAAELGAAAAGQSRVRVIETPHGGHIGQLGLYPDWTLSLLLRFFALAPAVGEGGQIR